MSGGLTLLPPPAGKCRECAVDHAPTDPHNKDSLYYQYHFYGRTGRWPTWDDALAHCSEEVRRVWRGELDRMGVK